MLTVKQNVLPLLVAACTLSLSSCYYDVEEELYPSTSCDLSDTKFASTVDPIITTNCAVPGCHVPGGTTPDLTTYDGVKANVDNGSIQQRALVDKDMPASAPLSSCDQAKLQAWIDNGAINN